MSKLPSNTIWSDRKRTFFGLPWTFTKYILTDDKMLVIKGFLNQKEEEIRLYRVMDLSLKRSLFQMFFGMPARIVNSQGRAVQGILGFTDLAQKIISGEAVLSNEKGKYLAGGE